MGLHTSIIRMLEARRQRARLRRKGALGDFHRAGGAALLDDVPVSSDDVVIDAGGFEGDWTAAMLVRSGSSSVISCSSSGSTPFSSLMASLTIWQ